MIREAGLKLTRPRASILAVLESSQKKHLSAEDVFQVLTQQGQQIGFGTVYRVLTQFESAGIVKRHNFEEGHAVFELHQENHHDHLVCLRCGQVKEFFDEKIENCQDQIAEKMGFAIIDHSHVIYGYCSDPECTEK
ncbi:MAG: ferric iron uptake transcriptional regulator [Chromatiales bacterium]|nr:ferric iron uptake transcriptional regulator [Chromatiales bacterium]